MRHFYTIMISTVLVVLFGWSQAMIADEPDTLLVEWADADGFIITNALRDAIHNDVDDGIERVYKLERGGFYFIESRIETPSDFDLRIIGESGPADVHPAVFMPVNDDAGGWDERMVDASGSLTLKNLYVIGRTNLGNEGWEPIRLTGSGGELVVDNCVFEYNFSPILAVTGANNSVYLTNSHFRNLIHDGQYWAGRGISIWNDVDVVYVENNTFFNVNGFAVQIEGGKENHFWFNHNTIVNTGRHGVIGDQWTDGYFTNNLFVNSFWTGETAEDFSPARLLEDDNTHSGMIQIDFLDPAFGFEDMRAIGIYNNATFRHQEFLDYYAAYQDTATVLIEDGSGDAIRAQPLLNPRAMNLIAEYEFMKLENLIEGEDPNFTFYPENLNSEMIRWVQELRTGADVVEGYWWDPAERDPDALAQTLIWPLPEDFSYDNATLLNHGRGGYPVGDLNWFPDEKASWEFDAEQLREDLLAEFEPPEFDVVTVLEGRHAVLDGDATLQVYDGVSYFNMTNTGYIEWTFELEEAATIDLVVTTRSGSAERGQRIKVNGQNIRNNDGYGEWFWDALDPEVWEDTYITKGDILDAEDSDPAALDLLEGENTVRIEPSWGWQQFKGIQVIVGGDVIHDLGAMDAEFELVSLILEDDDGEEVGFPITGRWIEFEDEGSATWTFDAPRSTYYVFRFFYQAPHGTKEGEIRVNGEPVLTQVFDEDLEDEFAALEVASEPFLMEEGTHDVTLFTDWGWFNLDYIQVFAQEGVVSVPGSEIVEGFQLMQNYPNPFNPATIIQYSVPQMEEVVLKVYNVLGQEVKTLVNEVQTPGTYQVTFDASHLSSGVYFYRLQAGDYTEVKKMMFLK